MGVFSSHCCQCAAQDGRLWQNDVLMQCAIILRYIIFTNYLLRMFVNGFVQCPEMLYVVTWHYVFKLYWIQLFYVTFPGSWQMLQAVIIVDLNWVNLCPSLEELACCFCEPFSATPLLVAVEWLSYFWTHTVWVQMFFNLNLLGWTIHRFSYPSLCIYRYEGTFVFGVYVWGRLKQKCSSFSDVF